MKLSAVQPIAADLIKQMQHYCHRCEIAGSIRRQKPEVKDIEIVAIPRWEDITPPGSLFADMQQVNRLYHWARNLSGIYWLKPGTQAIVPWNIKEDGKYWRGLLPHDIKLDLFIAAPDNWGIIFAIRTGSAEFTQALVTHAARIGYPCKEGYIRRAGQPVPTPEERDVFDLLGVEWIEPELRHGFHSLRTI
jgi:DNA polymerase/3'-5' exonuclease PolX